MKNEDPMPDDRPTQPKVAGHVHEWRHDDVEPDYPPVSVSTCSCGAIRRSWQADDGEFREEISYMS